MKQILAALLLACCIALTASHVTAGFDEGKAAYDAGDYATALQEFRPLAEAGDPAAQDYLGSMYLDGQGVAQDHAEAVHWFRAAADQGHAGGQVNLGYSYYWGLSVPEDRAEALRLYRLAADQGDPAGQHSLAGMYQNGDGVTQDMDEAVRLYRLAADGGYAMAQFWLGDAHLFGWGGVEIDPALARDWLIRAAAQDNPQAISRLAELAVLAPQVAETLEQPEAAPLAPAGRRIALVIANAAYPASPLNNPRTDLALVVPVLEGMGFIVSQVVDADLPALHAAVSTFAEAAEGADVALFYYAGHGFAMDDGLAARNYLISVSADLSDRSPAGEFMIKRDSYPLDEIIDQISAAAEVSLFFIDACRNSARGSGGRGRGLGEIAAQQGRVFVGLSTRLGDIAEDGVPGEGSPFARAFAENIALPDLRLDDAFDKVRVAVQSEIRTQRPEAIDDLFGPLVLVTN